ncbi:NAD(P)H-dependent oxidoreductase [Ferruginibacter lapsinanis]|uniref:NADPH-dependent FMN reductase n=1 Tax=Ferruginibacter lapsinanis TaxID=563172 RepID=UPI001E48E69D|nr:NAD(P)H-dependent oxidoreductase [Ferruginibacter lapsinanis]UEG48644.1 NAD(P)H-dependent oxidoreductase [Ferruginibacter lapsinanis]
MITIIAGTNREDSYTLRVAKEYQRILAEKGVDANVFSLEGINLLEYDEAFKKIESEIIAPTDTFIFITPEYNGSFPGALKLFFDMSKPRIAWWHKKALLTGIATGRAGNLRGMDHLSAVLNHLKITVHHNQLPISSVDKLMDVNGRFTDDNTLKVINTQLDDLIHWIKS